MGTITARRRKNGTTGYTAQIRLKRDGKLVHTEAETFSTKALAREWMTRREADLDTQRARGEPMGKRMTLGDMVAWYEGREREGEPWGRTKKADLARLKVGPLREKRADMLTRSDFIAYIDGRRDTGAGPATAANDLIWLRQVFRSASAVLHTPVPLHALDAAAEYLRGERTIAKPKQRDRRITPSEEAKLLRYLDDRHGEIPMGTVVRFALLTARRQEEITRLRWDDLDLAKGVALLRNVKHPTKKIGNHKTFRMLAPAWELVQSQERAVLPDGSKEPLVFPFSPKSIGAAFTRATRYLGIDDLHFHDLRHEATSRLFEKGYSIQEVAQFTLHESWMTLKRYTHLKPEDVPER
ncbi:integrase [Lysobacter soli]|uniref:integrase n=1 Tax=Lysobacter soli TaxID=453783 RepID=UPI003CFA3303